MVGMPSRSGSRRRRISLEPSSRRGPLLSKTDACDMRGVPPRHLQRPTRTAALPQVVPSWVSGLPLSPGLLAAFVAADGMGEDCRVTSGAELGFLEGLGAPTIYAEPEPLHQPLRPRYVVLAAGPVRKIGKGYPPGHQEYPARTGALVRPGVRVALCHEKVVYAWEDANPADLLAALRLRAARIGYLGCADSPVRLRGFGDARPRFLGTDSRVPSARRWDADGLGAAPRTSLGRLGGGLRSLAAARRGRLAVTVPSPKEPRGVHRPRGCSRNERGRQGHRLASAPGQRAGTADSRFDGGAEGQRSCRDTSAFTVTRSRENSMGTATKGRVSK